jgi:hypothetical protein
MASLFTVDDGDDGGGEDTNLSTTTLGFIEKYLAAADLMAQRDDAAA